MRLAIWIVALLLTVSHAIPASSQDYWQPEAGLYKALVNTLNCRNNYEAGERELMLGKGMDEDMVEKMKEGQASYTRFITEIVDSVRVFAPGEFDHGSWQSIRDGEATGEPKHFTLPTKPPFHLADHTRRVLRVGGGYDGHPTWTRIWQSLDERIPTLVLEVFSIEDEHGFGVQCNTAYHRQAD